MHSGLQTSFSFLLSSMPAFGMADTNANGGKTTTMSPEYFAQLNCCTCRSYQPKCVFNFCSTFFLLFGLHTASLLHTHTVQAKLTNRMSVRTGRDEKANKTCPGPEHTGRASDDATRCTRLQSAKQQDYGTAVCTNVNAVGVDYLSTRSRLR